MREAATAALYRLRSAAERLDVRRESVAGLLEGVRVTRSDGESRHGEDDVQALERDAAAAAARVREAAVAREARVREAARAAAALVACERLARSEAEQRLAGVVARRMELDAARRSAGDEREHAAGALARLRAASERLAVRGEEADAMLAGLREELAEAERIARLPGPSREELERAVTRPPPLRVTRRVPSSRIVGGSSWAASGSSRWSVRSPSGRDCRRPRGRSRRRASGLPSRARRRRRGGARGRRRARLAGGGRRRPDPPAALALLEQARAAGLGR